MTDEDFSALAAKEKLTIGDILSLLRKRGFPGEKDEAIGIGDHGIYQITKDGIRAEPITHEELSLLTVEEQKELLKFKEIARLDSLCTPAELVAWEERQGGEFVLLESFVEAVRIKSPEYRAASTSAAKRECEKWLLEIIKAGPPQKPKKEYQQEAIAKFKNLSARSFLATWKNAIDRAGQDGKVWSNPGRKRKKKL